MGVIIEEEDLDTFDMLKELEIARANLYDKQQSSMQNDQNKKGDISADNNETLLIEWHHEEPSESEDFLLAISNSRDTRTGRKKKVKISPSGKKQDQEDFGLPILNSEGIKVPLNVRKRKKSRKK